MSCARSICALSAAICCALPGAGHAAPSAVRIHLDSAARFYRELEYERALEQLTMARAVSESPEDDARIGLYEGVVLDNMNRSLQADAAFRGALLIDPDAKLPLPASPKIKQRFEAARAQVKRELANRSPPRPMGSKTDVPKPTHSPEPPRRADGVPRPSPPSSSAARPGFPWRSTAWIPASAGGALAITGGVFFGLSRATARTIETGGPELDIGRQVEIGRRQERIGIILIGVGAAALAAGGAMALFGGPTAAPSLPAVAIGLDRQSVFLSVGGQLP